MKPLETFARIALISGLLFAWLCGWMALDNNNQGEFRDQVSGAMHWDAFIPVVALSFAYVTGLVFGALSLGLLAFRMTKNTIR